MPLSEKALLAAYSADVYADNGETPTLAVWRKALTPALSAFQAALLEDAAGKVDRALHDERCADQHWCKAMDYAVYKVRALLSPPPPEPRFRVGDFVTLTGAAVYVVTSVLHGEPYGLSLCNSIQDRRIEIVLDGMRPATDEEVRRARGEEQP